MARPISIDNPVDILVSPDKRITFQITTLAGGVEPLTGDFRVKNNGVQHEIAFSCLMPFVVMFTDFDDATAQMPGNRPVGQRGRAPVSTAYPFDSFGGAPASAGPWHQSTDTAPYTLSLRVKNGAQYRGAHKYAVIVTHTDGSLVTIDPQIIVDH